MIITCTNIIWRLIGLSAIVFILSDILFKNNKVKKIAQIICFPTVFILLIYQYESTTDYNVGGTRLLVVLSLAVIVALFLLVHKIKNK